MRIWTVLLLLWIAPASLVWAQPVSGGVPNAGHSGGQAGVQAIALAEGDGVRMEVFTFEQGNVTGRFFTDGQYVPFQGSMTHQAGVNVIQGSFDFQGQAYGFTTRQPDGQTVRLTIGSDTYVMQIQPLSAPQPASAAPAPAQAQPAVSTPPTSPGLSVNASAGAPERIEFRRVAFPDPGTGVDEAYTMLVPKGWQAQGQVAWSEGKFPFPTFTAMVRSPQGESIVYPPSAGGIYAPGMTNTPPPPQDVARFVAQHLGQHLGQVRVVSAVREPEREQATLRAWAQIGIPERPGRRLQAWRLTLAYQEQGVAMRLDTPVLLATTPTQGAVIWNVHFSYVATGPEATYEQRKGLLFAVASSCTTTPTWFHVRHVTLANIKAMNDRADAQAWMEVSRRGHEIRMRDIHGWGQTAMQVAQSDAGVRQQAMTNWRKQQASADWNQSQQLKMLHGVKDYEMLDGQRISLPQKYGYVYQSRNGDAIVVSSQPVLGPEAQNMDQLLPATGRPEGS
ncbi:MAG: hypothetical protein AAF288_13565 [Planctomycetota bacterium]